MPSRVYDAVLSSLQGGRWRAWEKMEPSPGVGFHPGVDEFLGGESPVVAVAVV